MSYKLGIRGGVWELDTGKKRKEERKSGQACIRAGPSFGEGFMYVFWNMGRVWFSIAFCFDRPLIASSIGEVETGWVNVGGLPDI